MIMKVWLLHQYLMQELCLLKGLRKETSLIIVPRNTHHLRTVPYGRISEMEVRTFRGKMNRKTASVPDLVGIAELNQLTDKQIAMIFNKWWGLGLPDTAKEWMTTLLPKTIEERRLGKLATYNNRECTDEIVCESLEQAATS